jgi:protein-L-isoaspartate O-methyltransferase
VNDVDLAAPLRAALDSAGYTEPAVEAALGRPVSQLDPATDVRRLAGAGRLGTLIRLFLLGAPVRTASLRDALAPAVLDRLQLAGLVRARSGVVTARVRLVPYAGLVLACDPLVPPSARLPRHVVDGVTLPARLLAALTLRHPMASVLDIGTGGGVHALLAARHSRRVVATDVNPRALRYAAFNVRLNGLGNVELRRGSLFDAVAGERFDLIVANPPYVISPEATLSYRDSGDRGDRFCQRLVQEAPRFLAEGGWSVMLVNWVHGQGEAWWTPLQRWIEARGVDAWLLRYQSQDPIDYAAAWNGALAAADPARYARALDRWLAYYRRLEIGAIAGGAILMRRRDATRHWLRADSFPNEVTEPAGEQIARMADAQDFVASLSGTRALLDARLSLVAHHRVDTTVTDDDGHQPDRTAVIRLEAPLAFRVEVPALTLALLTRMRGTQPLRDAIQRLAQTTGRPAETLTRTLLPGVRALVRCGLLERA